MLAVAQDSNAVDHAHALRRQVSALEAQLRKASHANQIAAWKYVFRGVRYLPTLIGVPAWVMALVAGSGAAVLACTILIITGNPGFLSIVISCLLGYAIAGGGLMLAFRDGVGENDDNRKEFRHALLVAAQNEQHAALNQIAALKSQLLNVRRSLDSVLQLINSRAFQLLHVNPDALNPDQFEHFVADIFRHLGYTVLKTGKTGDQGVDVLAERPGSRLAIQVKHWSNSVGNGAVQEAYAGRAHYRCTGCAVFTSNYFTSSARSLAASTGCILIDRDAIPAVIRGERIL
jgi:HJR/Mrr/RecB family endonuclease